MSYYNQQQPPVGVPPPQGYPPEGYPKDAYPPPGYPAQGYPQGGYPPPQGGYPPQGYPPQGYPPPYAPQYGQPPPQQQQQSVGFMEGCIDGISFSRGGYLNPRVILMCHNIKHVAWLLCAVAAFWTLAFKEHKQHISDVSGSTYVEMAKKRSDLHWYHM
ncbi:hypothetical protein KSS87_010271 [Heliosperma pusillum]|nr:hypothetical protein KSS87_010271 [Heliosperma pusillum]